MEALALFGALNFWFVVFILAVIVVGIFASEFDSYLTGAVTFIGTILGLEILFKVPVLAMIWANPLTLLALLIVYVGVGSLYTAYWRWPKWLEKKSEYIRNEYRNWKSNRGNDSKSIDDFLSSDSNRFAASRNKDRIAAWILVWPFSFLWEILRNPVIWVYENFYSFMGKVFERVGTKKTKDILSK